MANHSTGLREASGRGTPVMRRIAAAGDLTAVELSLVEDVLATPSHHPVRHVLAAEGKPVPAVLLASGWACRQRVLNDGRRQIVSFVLPGDPLFPIMRPAIPASCAAVALTPVVTLNAAPLLAYAQQAPADAGGLANSLRMMDRFDEFLLRDQIVRLGRQIAYERMVHLILELFTRLDAAGLVSNNSFSLPLTQEILADALGLSVVHVNRVLQQIRRDRLMDMRSGMVTILNLPQMQQVADWTPIPLA